MRSQGQPRVFFVHLQKTAGSELIRLLINQFGERAVYPARAIDGANPFEMVTSIDYLRERFAARGHEIRVVAGHFPLCTAEILKGAFTTMTMMREPVERTLSYLRHRAQSPRHRGKPLEEIYEDRHLFESFIHNHMTKMLALSPDELTDGMLTPVTLTEAHLARAKERLAAMDAVGHQESFGEFCAELTRRFGWRLGEPEMTNTTKPTEASPALRAKIAEDNSMDLALHEFAQRLTAPTS